jgi:hypothetical protein
MFRLRWFPWRFVVRRVARAHGFLDPIALLSHLRRLMQPSEVAEPVELLRAGVVLHARGLVNSRVIQHNLDWVWPYWVERQFDPLDAAFVPRAFSITHINLTHRNWTAVGLPDLDAFPIVDPRGLLTPLTDGFSLDAWIVTDGGRTLLPSRSAAAVQRLDLGADTLRVVTESREEGLFLTTTAEVVEAEHGPVCRLRIGARSGEAGHMVVALRPCNPEGISFVHQVRLTPDRRGWLVNGETPVRFGAPVERHRFSTYAQGDVHIHLRDPGEDFGGECDVGLATAAALFALAPGQPREVTVEVPVRPEDGAPPVSVPWRRALQDHAGHAQLNVPDARYRFLYDAALRTLILHAPGEVYPGPYTYRRFWFRDAAFILHALLCAGLTDRAERALDRFPGLQTAGGYFHSQDGEWDSNGEALWALERFCALTGRAPKAAWRQAIRSGARWIVKKRMQDDGSLHGGLLPAGFSAEHLGPNDYYYWDDFWGVQGLLSAARMLRADGDASGADRLAREADDFLRVIERSLARAADRLGRAAMPAAPSRRLDAGAVGSLAAGYPLQLFPEADPRLKDTAAYLMDECFVGDGFFQDMVHSGINAYLTLHVAQVLLRAGDPRHAALVRHVAELASPTGQWPEAIHPHTGGGCMGDGQHVWAAAEWVMMMRALFLREEGDRLVLCEGIDPAWLDTAVSFGPAPTAFGKVTVSVRPEAGRTLVTWHGWWHGDPPEVEVRLPGHAPARTGGREEKLSLVREDAP